MPDEERIAFLMKQLDITREEAIELEKYDDDVNRNKKTEHDLTPEQVRVVQEMTRKVQHKKYGSVKRERKPNEIKEALVRCLADFLENECEFLLQEELTYCDSVEVTNKNRMIHFKVNDKEFDLQLIEKRPPKKEK